MSKTPETDNLFGSNSPSTFAYLCRDLETQRDEVREALDLMCDEFQRIKALNDLPLEAHTFCDRAITGIKQRVPLIEQRDKAEKERDEARAEAKREGDRARQEQDRSHQAEWKAFQANLALVEARAEVRLLRKAIADVLPGMKCQPLPKLGAWNWPWAVVTLEEVLKDEVATRKSPLLTAPIVSTQPEIFEAHRVEWYRHTPGDKMPCESGVEISILLKCGDILKGNSKTFGYWGTSCPSDAYIIGWRPADAPEKLERK